MYRCECMIARGKMVLFAWMYIFIGLRLLERRHRMLLP
jgi:hypothetical protein